ncbi:MAG: LPP20 family lipoprotein [Vicingaceae bacterium]
MINVITYWQRNYLLLTLTLLMLSSCSYSQKTSKKKGKEKEKPEWVTSRPVDRSYYQGIGVAMVNSYNQDHVEQAKKKALNDLVSEISVKVKSTSMMQQIERNQELNSMFQNLTSLSAENDIEGYELYASWGDDKEYWVYYRLSKELYNRNKLRRLDRARSQASLYYESGIDALKNGDAGRAYQDFVKGLLAIKEYLDEELFVVTDNGKEYLADALINELIGLNRSLEVMARVSNIKTKVGKPVEESIVVRVDNNGGPVGELPLSARFTTGSGEMNGKSSTSIIGEASFSIRRVTGSQNVQVLEIGPDIEGLTGEEEGQDLMARLIRLKTDVPSARVNIEIVKILAYVELEETRLGEKVSESSFARNIKNKLAQSAYTFTTDKSKAEAIVKLSISSRKGEELPLKERTLYTCFLDLFVTVTDSRNSRQLFYKGITDIKGSRSGDFEKALTHAESQAMERFEKELLPEIGNVDF